MPCTWCGMTLYWKKMENGKSTPYEDQQLTKVHICPKRPHSGEPNQQPTGKPAKVPPLTDHEILFLRDFVHFCEGDDNE